MLGLPGLQLAGMPLHLRQWHRQRPGAHHPCAHPGGAVHAGLSAYAQWAALPAAESAGTGAETRLEAGAGAVTTLTAEEYAHLEKTHLCCTVSAISDNREPLLPHWHVEGS